MDKQRIVDISTDKRTLIAAAFLVGAASGGTGGYLLARKALAQSYAELADEEIAKAKEYYTRTNKTGDFSDPITAANATGAVEVGDPVVSYGNIEKVNVVDSGSPTEETYQRHVQELKYWAGDDEKPPIEKELEDQNVPEVPTEQIITRNAFEDARSEHVWNYDEELRLREGRTTFVIHEDEFNESEEAGFEQGTLTYFAGDTVLANENDEPVGDDTQVDRLVGLANLQRFGHGTADKRVVHVRNTVLQTDFEIVMSDGRYDVEALGFEPPDSITRTFRSGDGG